MYIFCTFLGPSRILDVVFFVYSSGTLQNRRFCIFGVFSGTPKSPVCSFAWHCNTTQPKSKVQSVQLPGFVHVAAVAASRHRHRSASCIANLASQSSCLNWDSAARSGRTYSVSTFTIHKKDCTVNPAGPFLDKFCGNKHGCYLLQ